MHKDEIYLFRGSAIPLFRIPRFTGSPKVLEYKAEELNLYALLCIP